MFRKPASSSGKKTNLSQFGLLDIPGTMDDDDEPMDESDDDVDLEAELAAITGGASRPRPRKPAPVPGADLDAMIAASLQDVPSDDDIASGDEDDPELLSELKGLSMDESPPPTPKSQASRPAPPPPNLSTESSTISLLQDRILNYTAAEKNAKAAGESSRARRFGRGLKTLNDLLKQAKSGRPVNDMDIPPPVAISKAEPPSAPSAPPAAPPSEPEAPAEPEAPPVPPRAASLKRPTEDEGAPEPKEPPPPPPAEALDPARQQGLMIILKRKEELKAAALSAKQNGDKALALEYLKAVKQFDIVVSAYKAGQEMDLNELPTVGMIAEAFRGQKEEEHTQGNPEPAPAPEEAPALITASTMEEALRQRLAAFQEQESKAKEQGNSSKARRMGRIVKQYEDALKLHRAGRPVPVDELPPCAGHAPIPTAGSPAGSAPPAERPGAAAAPPPAGPLPKPRAAQTRYDKQLALLLHRQKEFREAALRAKKAGNIEQAREYLRAAKGFDAVIDAAKGGLAVDLKSLPLPPQEKKKLEHTFDVVTAEDCTPTDDAFPSMTDDVLSPMHQQLTSQLKLCLSNRDHYRAMGNVAETNRFENLAVRVKQDLDLVTVAQSLNQTPPKFHYETKEFAVVQCNTDLNENDLELTIVRGVALNVPNPKEVDTYVKFEFPYPQEAPVSDRTAVVKDTNSPEYSAVFPLAIQRGSRPCLRVFKRHGIKFEVYSRGGWFSKDTLLGTVTVKLAPLETNVTLHESYPLMDGRRPAGGALEVKLRVRTPLLQQQIDTTSHRWLLVDT